MTITIDGTVGANKGVVLDSNGKLPVIDGSQVTTLNATQVTTGTVATARLDTGTTAGKVLVLDGSGNMPAVDATLMTGVVSATKSASSPTVSTNPSGGLGTKWIKTGTGDVWICTDATAGANVWTNTGAGTGDIGALAYGGIGGGTSYGWAGGGYPGPLNSIEYFSFASDGGGTDAGNLTRNQNAFAPASSTTHGYVAGGANIPVADALERFQFSNNGNAADIGSLASGSQRNTPNNSAVNSSTHGYCAGGSSHQSIEKFTFAASATNTIVGNLVVASVSMAGHSSYTHGYFSGRSSATNHIERLPFASDAGTTDVGDLAVAVSYATGTSSNTHGYTCSGGNSGGKNHIQKFAYAASSNATDIGDLTIATGNRTASASEYFGYIIGGSANGTLIEKLSFTTDGASTGVGNMTAVRHQPGGWQS